MRETTKILLLETDEGSALLVRSALSSLSCEVQSYLHPHEALFTVGDDPPDLLFISSSPSKTTPAGFLSRLHSINGCKDIYAVCIFPPGPEQDAEQEQLIEGDFCDCLRRPITRDDLSMVLTRWRQARREASREVSAEAKGKELEKMSLRSKLHQEVSAQSIKSALQHDLSKPPSTPDVSNSAQEMGHTESAAQSAAFAAIEDATGEENEEAQQAKAKPQGPQLSAEIDGEPRTIVIEMALGKSLMVLADGEAIEVGSEFAASLSYRDPAPGRNRMIPMQLKLRVGSCTPVEGIGCRCSLRVEDVRPSERWEQFVRVCRAALEA